MPDIIFILLFFFMATAIFRTSSTSLKITLPNEKHLTEAHYDHNHLIIYIQQETEGLIIESKEIKYDLNTLPTLHKNETNKDRNWEETIVVLYADENTEMGDIHAIKEFFRNQKVRKIFYALKEKDGKP